MVEMCDHLPVKVFSLLSTEMEAKMNQIKFRNKDKSKCRCCLRVHQLPIKPHFKLKKGVIQVPLIILSLSSPQQLQVPNLRQTPKQSQLAKVSYYQKTAADTKVLSTINTVPVRYSAPRCYNFNNYRSPQNRLASLSINTKLI